MPKNAVKMAVFNYHLANPIYDQLIITVRAMIQQLSSGLPGHMVYCEPWRILRTDVYNMLWLKIIIYDYDMIILGITWKNINQWFWDWELQFNENALLIYFQNGPDK